MTDCTKLVEALQADVDKANKTADAYRSMYKRIEELESEQRKMEAQE